MLCEFDHDHCDALKGWQQYADKHDTCIDVTIIPIVWTVAVKREHKGPWYKRIQLQIIQNLYTMTDHIITRTAHNVKHISISTE